MHYNMTQNYMYFMELGTWKCKNINYLSNQKKYINYLIF